jgi:ERF superfamily protein
MTTSEQIHEIATALAKAQGEMGGAVKDSANPFFKSKYADLASVWDACRGPLSKHGLAVVQSPSAEGMRVSVDTLLTHTSGQWMRGTVSVNAKDDSPQAVGSAITYLRRYALQSFAGVAPEDDDAEAAQGRSKPQQAAPAAVSQSATVATMPPAGYQDWLLEMFAVADEGTDRLNAEWKTQPEKFRGHLTRSDVKNYDAMRAKAKKANEKKPVLA